MFAAAISSQAFFCIWPKNNGKKSSRKMAETNFDDDW